MTRSGVDYAGTQNRTISGSSCIPWLNTAFKNSTAFPEGNATDASNYCRNPSPYVFVDGVWCFTTNSGLWEFCSVPLCGKLHVHLLTLAFQVTIPRCRRSLFERY